MSKPKYGVGHLFQTPQGLAGMPPDTSVLLALSGGADSRTLLHLLAKQAKQDGFGLLLAHVNHGIRGEEAVRDRDFCQALANRYGLELCILDADVPALAKEHGRGLEEEARAVRYAFFEHLMRERDIPLLATAHNADDQLETVLFRLSRGTGLAGLSGIAPVRRFANGWLTRPLLTVPRREILSYCAENGLEYVTDSTNADIAYARNRIRAEIIPVLGSIFDAPQLRVCEMAHSLREDEAYLSDTAARLLAEAETAEGLRLACLCNAPVPIVRRALMRWLTEQTGHSPERVHMDSVTALLTGRSKNAEVALPSDYVVAAECGLLRLFQKRTAPVQPFLAPFRYGELYCEDLNVCVHAENRECLTKINNLSTQSCINLKGFSAIIKNSLFWRTLREGDTLLLGGMHKKLRKLYASVGISPHRRAQIPLLCDGEGIVWAPFVGVRDGFGEDAEADGESVCITVELLCATSPLQRNG